MDDVAQRDGAGTGSAGAGEPWFAVSRQPHIRDVWAVYEQHFDQIQRSTAQAAQRHPQFAAVLGARTAEEISAQHRQSRELLRRAVEGEWGPYEANLRAMGTMYARMGLGFAPWHDLITALHVELIPMVVEAYLGAPARLQAALVALTQWLDRVLLTIANQFVVTKEELIRDTAAAYAELTEKTRRVEEASRLKSEFLANMSHELRTPLNAIIGFSELLHDGAVGPVGDKQREFLGDILVSGQHLQQLINDILDLSKVEAGKMEFYPEPLAPGAVLAEVLSILRPTAAGKRLRIETELAPGVEQVTLDPGRLKQVLYNYLSNAIKFTGEGGRIVARVLPEDGERFRLEVEDTGVGIAPEKWQTLFTEFQQLDAGAGKRHQGTGLGLALTRRLVEAQGGSVGIRSTPGVGSTFHAILPRRAQRSPGAARPRVVASENGAATSILVVEDDAGDQQVLITALAAAGFAVEAVATGGEAIARCRERTFDAVTLDLLLPDMSGLEVLKAIRSGGKNPDVPVVVITLVAEKIASGFVVQDVLAKPIEPAGVVAALERYIVPREGRSVLVVDDDPGSRKLMAAALAQLGCQTRCFADARSALAAVDADCPSIVVLDLMLPGMDGFAFLREFRQREPCRRVPVLVWTVKDLSADERVRLLASAQAIIPKGQERGGALLKTIADHLPAPPAAREEATHGG